MELEAAVLDEVRALFEGDSGGHDFFHTLRVYKNAMQIAEKEPCDHKIVMLAALLHDADDDKLFETEDHANARAVMARCGVDDATAEAVIAAISTVSFKDGLVPGSIEGCIVQDADRLDALGAVGIARTFAFGGSHSSPMHDPDEPPRENMTAEEYRARKGTSVNHFYEKLFRLRAMMNTGTARRVAESREEYMRGFLERFLAEWDGRDFDM